jgi:hypothetical protein
VLVVETFVDPERFQGSIYRASGWTELPGAPPQDELVVRDGKVPKHSGGLNVVSADADRDFRISRLEFTRVIELYNTRKGTVRTGLSGAYTVAAVATEDGFATDPQRAADANVTLPRYHSADTGVATGARDGRIDLTELTRARPHALTAWQGSRWFRASADLPLRGL